MDGNGSAVPLAKSKLEILNVGGKFGHGAETRFYPGHNITTIDLVTGWDVMKKGLPAYNSYPNIAQWDVVLMNNFIEHVPNPDYVMDECRRVMGRETILDITTPNMASWFNRILLLFGFMPHCCEVSERGNYGKLVKTELAGHFRCFTHGALKEFLEAHGFQIIERTKEPWLVNPVFGLFDSFFSYFPSLESHTRFLCQLK